MRCKASDCFTCPYPDCINDEEPRARTYTPEQRDRHNARIRQLYAERRAAGLCVRCGEPAIPGKSVCKYHRWRTNKLRQERFHRDGIQTPREIMDGVTLCTRCGKFPPMAPYKICERCHRTGRHGQCGGYSHGGGFADAQKAFWGKSQYYQKIRDQEQSKG